MKKYIFTLALIILSLTGCDRDESSIVMQDKSANISKAIVPEIVSPYYDEVVSISESNVDKEIFGSYDMNYGDFSIDGVEYEGYRIDGDYDDEDSLFILYPDLAGEDDGTLPGAFYNLDEINGISLATISYEAEDGFTICYGNDRNNLIYEQDVPGNKYFREYDIEFAENVSYFRIESCDSEVRIESIDLYCQGDSPDETKAHPVTEMRYVPTTDYDPYEGEVLSIPVCEEDEDGSFVITEWKEYTYHSFDFINRKYNEGWSKEDIIKEYALTEPEDVSNYFILFNRIPVNFGFFDKECEGDEYYSAIQGDTPSISEVMKIFGKKYTRRVGEYSRKSGGYVDAVPVRKYKSGKPVFYEFDIDVDGTYTTKYRGTGRVVGFVGGFTNSADGLNATVYTDDHYFTFAQYANCGLWNERFDALGQSRTGNSFNKKKTATLIEPEDDLKEEYTMDDFTISEISDEVFERIWGKSFKKDCTTKREDLRYLTVPHKTLTGESRMGELIVNKDIAEDIIEIMKELYEADYPIEKMVLVDEYDADDERSMADNNTSAFNYRTVSHTNNVSKHGLGRAIDINPRYNPYITNVNDEVSIEPANGVEYADRTGDFPYKIDENDLAYKLFTEHGFTWGGNWKNSKDYQHFVK